MAAMERANRHTESHHFFDKKGQVVRKKKCTHLENQNEDHAAAGISPP